MTCLSLLLLFCAVSLDFQFCVNGQSDIEGRFTSDSKQEATRMWTENKTELMGSETNNCKSRYFCNGCHQIKICSTCPGGKYDQVSLVNCTGLTPYCKEDSGTCTAFIPERCAPLSKNFTCTQEGGSYPDPRDCTRYHVCKNYTAYAFKCRVGTFNVMTGECDRGQCYMFNCTSKNGVKIPYGGYSNVYAYCVEGQVAFVERCPINYQLNVTSQNCEPVCHAEGFLADSYDTTRYYVCFKLYDARNSKYYFVFERKVCPKGSVFDPIYAYCVFRDCKNLL